MLLKIFPNWLYTHKCKKTASLDLKCTINSVHSNKPNNVHFSTSNLTEEQLESDGSQLQGYTSLQECYLLKYKFVTYVTYFHLTSEPSTKAAGVVVEINKPVIVGFPQPFCSKE